MFFLFPTLLGVLGFRVQGFRVRGGGGGSKVQAEYREVERRLKGDFDSHTGTRQARLHTRGM